MIKTEMLSTTILQNKSDGFIYNNKIMQNEIEEVFVEYIAAKGTSIKSSATKEFYYVLLSLGGKASLIINEHRYDIEGNYTVKIPYNTPYEINIGAGNEFYFLVIKKQLDEKDKTVINSEPEKHKSLYLKAFSECIVYKEEIKSEKTLNRMILPERLVPRFCIGTVETTGPDEVGAHKHPMLEQLFLGLPGCSCTCYADDASVELKENMILHIPLGSTHSVSVDEGKKLSYIWMDFFKTIEGQDYISEQHQIDPK